MPPRSPILVALPLLTFFACDDGMPSSTADGASADATSMDATSMDARPGDATSRDTSPGDAMTGDAPGLVPTEANALKQFLTERRYMGFKAEPAVHASAGPHGSVRTFVNDVLEASWAAGNTVHPLGTASVKELYAGDNLTGWAVLVKTASDQAAKNYFWYEIINENIIANAQGAPLCANCHASGQDYVLTPAF